MSPIKNDKRFRLFEGLLYVLIALVYILLIGRYNAYDGDSRWFPSFSYAFTVDHVQTDTLYLERFPKGMGGVIAFGKLAAMVQGGVLNLVGWSLGAATSIGIVFVLASVFLLARTSRRLGYSRNFTLCLIALMGFTEPFVAASQRARYEFLAVFMLTLALYLAARNRVVFAVFIGALATEIEPAGVVIGLAIATFLLVENRASKRLSTPQLLLRIFAGAALALGVYFVLHPDIVSIFRTAHLEKVNAGNEAIFGGFVTTYYLVYARHLPELAVILVAIGLCLTTKRRPLLLQWPVLCAAVVILGSTILQWPQSAYFAFIAPFLGFFVLQVFFTESRRNLILAAILLFTLPQYIHRYKLWSRQPLSFSQRDQLQVDDAITRAAARLNKPANQLNILGDYALWYAHPNRFVSLSKRVVKPAPALLGHADLVLCLDRPLDPAARTTEEVLCGDLNRADFMTIDQFDFNHHTIQFLIHRDGAAQ